MLRGPQHERILFNYLNAPSVRPEHASKDSEGFFSTLLGREPAATFEVLTGFWDLDFPPLY